MNKVLYISVFFLVGVVALFLLVPSTHKPSTGMSVTLFKDYDCSCCEGYVNYLRNNGFNVNMVEMDETSLSKLKTELGVPDSVRSCHTVKFGNYIVEGHVPIESVTKMLKERPNIDGIALPGMPRGSPGMGGSKISKFVIFSFDNLRTRFFDKR